jgi:hypothetical protein
MTARDATHFAAGSGKWLAIAAILLAPLMAMQFTDEVSWTGSDFFAALLLGGAALAYDLLSLKVRRPMQRLAVGGPLGAAVLLAWAQGAVGIL